MTPSDSSRRLAIRRTPTDIQFRPALQTLEGRELPAANMLDLTTRDASGTINGAIFGQANVQPAGNGVSPDATQTFTLTVNEAPAITSANSTTFTVGTAGSFTVTTAFRVGLNLSSRSRQASSTATGETSRELTSCASSEADRSAKVMA